MEELLRKSLSDAQYAAVTDDSNYILCLACAGSGKSRTLAYRIARLAAEGTPPESIIAFTFTEKAAASLKQRVAEALAALGLPENMLGLMSIGTMDAFCHRLLGNINAKYREFSVLNNETLCAFLIKNAYEINVGKKDLIHDYFRVLKGWANAWQTLNNENIPLEKLKSNDPDRYGEMCVLRKKLLEKRFMDFSFAVRLTLEELAKPEARSAVTGYRYLLVDEYQDINPLQEAFIRTLSDFTGNLFVVGDDDQAIFGWRGADVQNILTFRDRYPNVAVHRLETNYRSAAPIVLAAAGYIEKRLGDKRLEKHIAAAADPEDCDLRKLTFPNRQEEAEWIAAQIRSLVGTPYIQYDAEGREISRRGLCFSDFAILLRNFRESKGSIDAIYASALKKAGIPVQIARNKGLFDRPCGDAVFRLLLLLKTPDPVSLEQLAFLRGTFPRADLDAIRRKLYGWQTGLYRKEKYFTISPQMIYQSLIPLLNADLGVPSETLSDLGAISRVIDDYEQTTGAFRTATGFSHMINYLRYLQRSSYAPGKNRQSTEPAVTISTIHGAKGLEYPVVFVSDFPAKNTVDPNMKPEVSFRSVSIPDVRERGVYRNTPEEEDRLYYTAFTRAERYLYVTGTYTGPEEGYVSDLQHPALRRTKEHAAAVQREKPDPKNGEDGIPTNFSALKHYFTCPYSYLLTEQYGFRSVPLELAGFGTTAHTAAERLHQRCRDHVPGDEDIQAVVDEVFLLRNISPKMFQYGDQKKKLIRILRNYCSIYRADFRRLRQDEARFEMTLGRISLTGFIDLLLHEDENREVTQADLIDFKTMELPDDIRYYNWRDMALQVQLYTKAVREVYGEKVRTGCIHTLKDNKRTQIPVDDGAVADAAAIIAWAAEGILAEDFPMRPTEEGCKWCDCSSICPKKCQNFARDERPPMVHTPAGSQAVLAVEAK